MTVPADTVLVHIPSMPSTRSENLSSSTSSASSTTSSKSNQAERPVDAVIYRHGRVEDAPHFTEMQFSNYLFHYHSIAPKLFLDTLDYPAMNAKHAKRMTRMFRNNISAKTDRSSERELVPLAIKNNVV